MVGYSSDSSDSEKKLFLPKTRGPSVSGNTVNDQNSEVSTTHGIVVNNRKPTRKSPTKKSRKINDSEPPNSPEGGRSSHDESPVRPYVRNIKTEKFSGSESEDAVPDSRNASKIREDSFDRDQVDDTERSFSKKYRIVVKREPVLSEDEETIIQRDPDDAIIAPQQKIPVFEDAGARSDSDAEIQPSQYWLHYHKENEKKEDKKTSPKKSAMIEDSQSEDSGETKRIGSQRKSPPRITKTEIISTKYKKANEWKPETREESSNVAEDFDDWVDVPKQEPNVSQKISDVNREEKVLRENENSENSRSSGDELKQALKKATPKSKKGIPKKSPASPKRKLSLKTVAMNKKTDKISPAKNKLNESLSKKLPQKRESICDKDTTSEEEEEERVEKQETPAKYVLALEKPKKSSLTPNGRQTTLVAKVNEKFEGGSKPKAVLQKRQTPKVSIPPVNNASRDSSSDEISSDEEPKPEIQAKISPKKKQQVSSSSEEESSVRKTPAIKKQKAGAASTSLKRKLDSRVAPSKKEPVSSSSDEEEEMEAPPVKRATPSQKRETIAHTLSGSASASMKKKLDAKVSSTDKRPASSSSSEEDKERKAPSVKRAAPKSQDQKITARSLSAGSVSASSNIKLDAKASSTKKKPASSSSDEEEEREAATRKQERTKSSLSTGSASSSLKRNLDLDESLSAGKTAEPSNGGNVPLRRNNSEIDSSEPESSKRAKLTPSHTMSDTDDTDSLTRFNTTLNKSITKASSENGSATKVEVKKRGRKETRKSVSINTKYKTKHVPNDTMNQKSILKKTDNSPVEDNTESDSLSQEQNVEKEVELSQEQTAEEVVEPSQEENEEKKAKPVVTPPKIIKRPLNLKELMTRENLTPDNAKASFRLEDLSDDDEIYILDVPRTVDPNELKGQTIRLGGKNKLQIEDQLYETCAKDSTDISCVFRTGDDGSSYKTVNIKPAGFISVRQKLSKTLQAELKPLEKSIVPFPENLKVRHPLFGAAFKDKIVIANIKVSKEVPESMKKIAKTSKAAKPEKKTTKLNNVGKIDKKKRESPEKLIIKTEIESKPKAKVKKTQRPAKEASSDSDSDGGFFRQIKSEVDVDETENRKDFRNLSIILDLEDVPSDPDLPTELEETVVLKRPKLSAKKKLGLSIDESAIKHKSFDLNSKHSSFFSSTPIKVEKDDKSYSDEVPVNKVRKRKNHSVS